MLYCPDRFRKLLEMLRNIAQVSSQNDPIMPSDDEHTKKVNGPESNNDDNVRIYSCICYSVIVSKSYQKETSMSDTPPVFGPFFLGAAARRCRPWAKVESRTL